MNDKSSEAQQPKTRTRVDRPLVTFLLLAAMGGVVASSTLFAGEPSMERNSFMFGLSLPRLLLAFVGLTLSLGLAAVAGLACLRPLLAQKTLGSVDSKIATSPTNATGVMLVLLYLVAVGGYPVLMCRLSLVPGDSVIQVVVERAFWLLVWLITSLGLFVGLMGWRYRRSLGEAARNLSAIRGPAILFLLVLLATLHWLTLILQAQWVSYIDGWFWPYTPKAFAWSQVRLVLVVVFGFLIAHRIMHSRVRLLVRIVLLVGAAYALQVGFGMAPGNGFESIRTKYDRAQFSDEMQLACESKLTTLAAVRDYERLYGQSFWYGTKPPGLFFIYSLARDFAQSVEPSLRQSSNACFAAVLTQFAWLMPLMGAMVVVPIMGLHRALSEEVRPEAASLLYMSAPNVLLMLLAPDQSVYPLLFGSATLGLAAALTRKGPAVGITAGVLTGLALFASFSLLPVVGLAFLWFILEGVLARNVEKRHRLLASALCVAAGFALVTGALAWVFHYDPLTRFTNAMAFHRDLKDFEFSLANLLRYGLLNNVELAFWAGVPLYILAAVGAGRSLRSVISGGASRHDVFAASFVGMYLLLNVIGQTRGEVGRIWMFLLPGASVIAATEASRLLRRQELGILIVFGLQLTTSVFAFSYLDWPW